MTVAVGLELLHDLPVVVTGAAGFLGRPLVMALAAAGARVLAIGRGAAPTEFGAWPSIRWLMHDLSVDVLAAEAMRDVAVVFHLAAVKEQRAGADERSLVRANEDATVGVIQWIKGTSARLVFASSQMVYGDPNSRAVTEETPLRGMASSPYACSKLNAEHWVQCLQQRRGGSAVSLRFCGFVGGGGNVDYMIDRAVRHEPIELFSQGEVCRDYLSLEDGVNAFLAAATRDVACGYHAINIGSGHAISSFDDATMIVHAVGSRSELICTSRPAPRGDFVYDIARARTLLGFVPTSLAENITSYARQQHATFLRDHGHG